MEEEEKQPKWQTENEKGVGEQLKACAVDIAAGDGDCDLLQAEDNDDVQPTGTMMST